jgi:hypothetical protein
MLFFVRPPQQQAPAEGKARAPARRGALQGNTARGR